jgi:hypothetical protein
MFKLFSSNHAASNPTDCSRNSPLKETLPGGPSPDTTVPLHEAVSRPYGAPAESASTGPLPTQQPSRNLDIAETRATYSRSFLSSEAREENNPTIGEGSFCEKAGRSASVASRRPNRSVTTNVASGDGAFANGAATAANGAPDVDPSLQSRAASAAEELEQRDKVAISKEERAFLH